MKAAVFNAYGPPEVLQIKELDKPVPKENEVLIRVYASSVSAGDARLRRADPFMIRLFFGLFNPGKNRVLGNELAGVVEAAGAKATRFNKGDRVFGQTGMGLGANAEYKCLAEDGPLELMPESLSFEQAAAIPFGGSTSLHFLRQAGAIESGQRILIYGASGSLGTAAVQLAHYFGAHVTGVCSGANVALVKSLGADEVLDYTAPGFTLRGKTYDIIYDTVGKAPFADCVKTLPKNGIFLRAAVMEFSSLLKGMWLSLTTGKKVIGGVARESRESLAFLKGLVEAGHYKPVIDTVYGLEQIVAAHRHVDTGHKKGTVVLKIQ